MVRATVVQLTDNQRHPCSCLGESRTDRCARSKGRHGCCVVSRRWVAITRLYQGKIRRCLDLQGKRVRAFVEFNDVYLYMALGRKRVPRRRMRMLRTRQTPLPCRPSPRSSPPTPRLTRARRKSKQTASKPTFRRRRGVRRGNHRLRCTWRPVHYTLRINMSRPPLKMRQGSKCLCINPSCADHV